MIDTEIPSPATGILRSIAVDKDETVAVGAQLAVIEGILPAGIETVQELRRKAVASLIQTSEELERRVDDLRAFEREYRGRLMAYLQGQLRDLDAGVVDLAGMTTQIGRHDRTVRGATSSWLRRR